MSLFQRYLHNFNSRSMSDLGVSHRYLSRQPRLERSDRVIHLQFEWSVSVVATVTVLTLPSTVHLKHVMVAWPGPERTASADSPSRRYHLIE